MIFTLFSWYKYSVSHQWITYQWITYQWITYQWFKHQELIFGPRFPGEHFGDSLAPGSPVQVPLVEVGGKCFQVSRFSDLGFLQLQIHINLACFCR